MFTSVLYHGNCYDGFGAAWAAWEALGDKNVFYTAVNYGEPPPWAWGDLCAMSPRIYLLDFSYSRAILERADKYADLTVIDHHKTAKDDLADLPFATFNLDKSGAVMAWEHFHPGKPVPKMLAYIEDRDLWRFALPGSREAAAWMRSHPFDFHTWHFVRDAFEDEKALHEVWSEGAAILRFQTQQVNVMADKSEWRSIGGYAVPIVNATVFFSEVGEELCNRHPGMPFAAYYVDWPDRRQWGLRSRSGFDCSAVAKQYGGGGHPGAAGFTTDHSWRGDPA